ncbi:MAG: cobaltochelatase subunit CobN, partial [Thermoguttaceae bacterium]|nr:cobaltochelatase subunit CobN [Thermoguttaceae bacterium]
SLEWLPGKSTALSNACWPDVSLGDLPNIYPYWITIVGEGLQAKRRGSACRSVLISRTAAGSYAAPGI